MNTGLIFGAQVVPLAVDEEGTVRVAGTRVSLDTVVSVFEQGMTAEEIQIEFPVLDLPDIYAVLAYYLANRVQVEAYLLARRTEASEWRQNLEARFAQKDIRDRLLARQRPDLD